MRDELNVSADEAAQRLLGCYIIREINGNKLVGKIVETEAYDQSDVASHSYRGKTPRTEVMFGPSGRLYVYFTYGMHYCCNIVVGDDGHGAAVLIRALEPLEGIKIMAKNRKKPDKELSNLCNGPAKLCQSFEIDKKCNGHDLRTKPLQLILKPPLNPEEIVQTTRVGISRGQDIPWRFYIKGNSYVSKL